MPKQTYTNQVAIAKTLENNTALEHQLFKWCVECGDSDPERLEIIMDAILCPREGWYELEEKLVRMLEERRQ